MSSAIRPHTPDLAASTSAIESSSSIEHHAPSPSHSPFCRLHLIAKAHASGPVAALETFNGLLYTCTCLNATASTFQAWNPHAAYLAPSDIVPEMASVPPTSAVAVSGSKLMATAHKDLKIRLWHSSSTGSAQPPQLVAAMPKLRQVVRNWTVEHEYHQTHRHGKRHAWMQHSDTVSVLAFSHDCSFLYSASWDCTVKVWSLRPDHGYLRCLESFTAHADSINTMLVERNDSLLYTGSADGYIKAWSRCPVSGLKAGRGLRSPRIKHSLLVARNDQTAAVNALVISHDDLLLYSGGSDGRVFAWRWNNCSPETEPATQVLQVQEILRGHARSVLSLDLVGSDNGSPSLLVSGSADKTIRLWRTTTRQVDVPSITYSVHQCVAVVNAHNAPVRSLRLCMPPDELREKADRILFSGSLDGSIKMWLLGRDSVSSASSSSRRRRRRRRSSRLAIADDDDDHHG